MRKQNVRVGLVELSMLSTYRESKGGAVTFFITPFSPSHQHRRIEAAEYVLDMLEWE